MARKIRKSVVVITGASSGIGRATATAFARKGAAVVLAARRADALAEVASECERLGGRALAVPTDVTDPKAVDDLARRAVEEFGRIDVWVNNAAVGMFADFESAPPEDFRRVVETNLFGTVNGMRAALPYLREQGRGVIINNASVYGKVGAANLSAYTTSKFGVVGLSESVRQELLGAKGISVSTVLPASIDTPFFQHSANYMGRAVKPIRPVYDAEKVADAIVRQARRPRREVIVGGAWRLLRQQRLLSPRAWEKMQATMVEHDHFEKRSAPPTPGNIHAPVPQGTGVSGDWPSSRGPLLRKAVPVVAVLVGASLLRRRSNGAPAALQANRSSAATTAALALRSLGTAAWFGGTLMGATAVNQAAGEISDPRQRARFAAAAWDRWTPVAGAALVAHFTGGAVDAWTSKGRMAASKGVAGAFAAKAGLSAAALAAAVAGRMLRKRAVAQLDGAGISDATTAAAAQRQLAVVEWVVPALTGAALALNARVTERRRAAATVRGFAARALPMR